MLAFWLTSWFLSSLKYCLVITPHGIQQNDRSISIQVKVIHISYSIMAILFA